MTRVRAVLSYTFREHLRQRAWLSSALFGVVLLAGGVLASALAGGERARLLLDLGLAANELLTLVSVVFLTVHLVLREIESRVIFLILTRPIERWHYVLGRFLGTLLAVALGSAVMAAAHWTFLLAFGAPPAGPYLAAWLCILGKTSVVGALALLLSLALTSEAAAMSFSLFLWLVGHFTSELRFMAERSASPAVKALLAVFAAVAPDFARFSYGDAWHAGRPGRAWLGWAAAYALAYTGACLALATELFEQKEF